MSATDHALKDLRDEFISFKEHLKNEGAFDDFLMDVQRRISAFDAELDGNTFVIQPTARELKKHIQAIGAALRKIPASDIDDLWRDAEGDSSPALQKSLILCCRNKLHRDSALGVRGRGDSIKNLCRHLKKLDRGCEDLSESIKREWSSVREYLWETPPLMPPRKLHKQLIRDCVVCAEHLDSNETERKGIVDVIVGIAIDLTIQHLNCAVTSGSNSVFTRLTQKLAGFMFRLYGPETGADDGYSEETIRGWIRRYLHRHCRA